MELRKIRDTNFTVSEKGEVFSPAGKRISTWIENPEKLPFVKHKNDDKTNNSAENLEWGANPDNVKEGYENGCYKFNTRSYKVYVTLKDTGEVLEFKSLRSLAETLNVNRKNVAAILDERKTNTYDNYEFSYKCPTTMVDECKPVESSDSKREAV